MNADDEAQAPSTNSAYEVSVGPRNAMFVDNLPENGHSPPAVISGAAAVSRSRPNYHARFILSGHTMSISALKFSADGSLLASSGASTTSIQNELSDVFLYRSKPPTSWSKFGTHILAKFLKRMKVIMRVSTTLHGRPMETFLRLRRTTNRLLFGTWNG